MYVLGIQSRNTCNIHNNTRSHLDGVSSPLLVEGVHVSLGETLHVLFPKTIKIIIYVEKEYLA
jgi:hypothetical protein